MTVSLVILSSFLSTVTHAKIKWMKSDKKEDETPKKGIKERTLLSFNCCFKFFSAELLSRLSCPGLLLPLVCLDWVCCGRRLVTFWNSITALSPGCSVIADACRQQTLQSSYLLGSMWVIYIQVACLKSPEINRLKVCITDTNKSKKCILILFYNLLFPESESAKLVMVILPAKQYYSCFKRLALSENNPQRFICH